jgi:hypothetical protein
VNSEQTSDPFGLLLAALEPWLDRIVIVEGRAHRLYRLHPDAEYPPLSTLDADSALSPTEGVLEETRAVALKETLAWQVQQAMEKDKISKVEMARRMNTSRAALDRL